MIVLPPLGLVARCFETGQMVFGSDFALTFFYTRAANAQGLLSGRLPLWESGAMCGYPVLADPQSALLYPPSWLFDLLRPGAAWSAIVLLHLILAGAFAYLWLRHGLDLGAAGSLAGSLVFSMSGYILTHVYAGHVTLVCAYPWLAALMWRLERLLTTSRGLVPLSLVVAVLTVSGYPMFLLVACFLVTARLAAVVLPVRRRWSAALRRCAPAVSAVVLGVLLAAPQLLPTMQLLGESQRAGGNPFATASSYSLPPENLVTFVAPTFFGDGRTVPYWGRWYLWEVTGFVGVGALALAVLGFTSGVVNRYLWATLAVAGIVISLGRYTPVFRVLYTLVPGVNLFRAPGRFLLVFILALLPLVAAGVRGLIGGDARLRVAAGRAGVTILLGGALLGASVLAMHAEPAGSDSIAWRVVMAVAGEHDDPSARELPTVSGSFRAEAFRNAWQSLLWGAVVMGVAGACLVILARTRVRGQWVAVAIGLLVAVELLAFGHRFIVKYEERRQAWPSPLADHLRGDPDPLFRVASAGAEAGSEAVRDVGRCQLEGLQHVGGYNPLLLRRYAELMNSIAGRPVDEHLIVSLSATPHPVLDMLGVRYWIVRGEAPPSPELEKVGTFDGVQLFRASGALPRAFYAARVVVLSDKEERLRFLASTEGAANRVAVLEKGREDPRHPGDTDVTVVASRPGRYQVDAASEYGGYLVLTEAYSSGWRVWVDGHGAEVQRANHLVQAVSLEPGRHRVVFQYAALSLFPGCAISFLCAIAMGGVYLWDRRRTSGAPGGGGCGASPAS